MPRSAAAVSFGSSTETTVIPGGPSDPVAALDRALARQENAAEALTFARAADAAAALVRAAVAPGEEIVLAATLDEGAARAIKATALALGAAVLTVADAEPASVAEAITARTRLVVVPGVALPTLRRADVAALASLAHRAGARLAVEHGLLTSALARPLEDGADAVLYARTTGLFAHPETPAGALAVRDAAVGERARFARAALRGAPNPFQAHLARPGLASARVRLREQARHADAAARLLRVHESVAEVLGPVRGTAANGGIPVVVLRVHAEVAALVEERRRGARAAGAGVLGGETVLVKLAGEEGLYLLSAGLEPFWEIAHVIDALLSAEEPARSAAA